MASSDATPVLEQLRSLCADARQFFKDSIAAVPTSGIFKPYPPDYWTALPEQLQNKSIELAARIAQLAQITGPAIRRAPLLTEVDAREAGHAFKGMRAAVRLRRFQHWGTQAIHDEGNVLGVQPAGESEDESVRPEVACREFEEWAESLEDRLGLTNPQPADTLDVNMVAAKPIAAGYRPGTAFIMMWMARDKPDLVDVSNTVKRCFTEFGISAVRSDDIEHEDVITQRILDEIKTAEFLFADLTGERPSVYYEVGYAHAIGRRVIMFRRVATEIHFDLAAYNCPEYQSLSELEDKLMKRLEHVTGRVPSKKTPRAKS